MGAVSRKTQIGPCCGTARRHAKDIGRPSSLTVRSSGTGTGLPKDEAMAYGWFILAENAGHPQAPQLRQALEQRLTPEEKLLGESWAIAFRSRKTASFADRPTVMYVQHRLNSLGYDAGPVDGFFGPKTREALKDFEQEQGFLAQGVLTPELLTQIQEASRAAI